MKKILFAMTFFICTLVLYAQQAPAVSVMAFDVQGGVTQDEANVVYELFVAELVSTGKVRVADRVNLNTILAEMRFQASDWSSPEKTASLGRALNAEIIIRGRLMKMGNHIYWTATMLDLRTAKVMFASQQRINDIGQIWNILPNFCKQLVDKINQPVVNPALLNNVAVSTFEVQGGITPEESGVITELFIASLVNTGRVNVIDRSNFDKILQEMRFQSSDWSNPNKTVELGRVTNVQNVIRGQIMKMGNTIFWTATILDVNTAQILSSSREQINNIDEIWGNKLTNFTQQALTQLPQPNYFIGRWECSKYPNGVTSFGIYTCILDIRADGTIIVERYDTMLIKGQSMPKYTGRGTGTYTTISKNNNLISTTITLNITGTAGPGNLRQSKNATISLNNLNLFESGFFSISWRDNTSNRGGRAEWDNHPAFAYYTFKRL